MKRAFKIISISLVSIIVLFASTVLIYFFITKGNIVQAPSVFGYKPLTILSNSMQPTFNAGDIILINTKKEPEVGDVVTYIHPDGVLVTHRAVRSFEKDGNTFIETKGDNNEQVDDVIISTENVVGVQKYTIPYAGYVAHFVSSPLGFFLLIVLPLVSLIIIEVFQRLGFFGGKKKGQVQV